MAVPFSPFVSAAFTAFDVLVVSIIVAFEEFTFPEAAHIRGTIESVKRLEDEIQAKAADVRMLREHLELVKEKIAHEQQLPFSTRLSDVLDKIRVVKDATDAYLTPQCD